MVYLDNAATTKVKKEVLDAMIPYFSEKYGNPSSKYDFANDPETSIRKARIQIADFLNTTENRIYFTSGGTESDNWAIIGVSNALKNKGTHIITSKIEHHAVLNTCRYLEKNGFQVTYLDVDKYGLVSPKDFKNAIRRDTILATIMYANNEIGTIQPIKELARIATENEIIFHTDAVQAAGQIKIDVNDLGVNLLSISAHKLYGPKGVGALYIKKGTRIHSFLHGGAQEDGKRATTENVPAIVGFGKAVELINHNFDEKIARIKALRDRLIKGVLEIEGTHLNGHPTERLVGNTNFCIKCIEGEALLLMLGLKGFMVSSGSACTARSLDPSHVLLAIGLPHETAHGSMRVTIGEFNTEDEIDSFTKVLPTVATKLREMSPFWSSISG